MSSIAFALAAILLSHSSTGYADPDGATLVDKWQRRAGWRDLFDGKTLDGWLGHGTMQPPGAGWMVEGGCLIHTSGGGDLVFAETFANFELEFEWQVEAGGNSGLKYRVATPEGSRGPQRMLGLEYQVLDDAGHVDGRAPLHRAGALYDLVPSTGGEPAMAGVFHRARIVADGDHLEHWLDGVRVVQVDRGGVDWMGSLDASKFRESTDFGAARPGLIGLQDHGDMARFRNIRLRDLDSLPGERVDLFDGVSLTGWTVLGDAIYEPDEGAILGRIGGGGQSFLITERTLADFILEVDVKTELPGNSGIQVRSHVNEKGRLYGYQIEIDSLERAWSGGLYDEGRRGWLDDLSDDGYARTAFRYQEWNHYRIECVGPTIRAWVNGIQTADFVDEADSEGVIGLQVHSGDNTRVRWRNLRLQDLGRSK